MALHMTSPTPMLPLTLTARVAVMRGTAPLPPRSQNLLALQWSLTPSVPPLCEPCNEEATALHNGGCIQACSEREQEKEQKEKEQEEEEEEGVFLREGDCFEAVGKEGERKR